MFDWRGVPPFRPQEAAPRSFPQPPSSSAPLRKKGIKNPQVDKNDPQAEKRQRNCAYNALAWTIQGLCALVSVLGIVWGTIQLLGLFNFLGISKEPPGLVYHVPGLAPEPPPPPA
jgi:hypothetical protein